MNAQLWVDTVQTAALIVTMLAQINTMLALRNEISSAALGLKNVLEGHAETMNSLAWLRKRVLAIEVRLGMHSDGEPQPPFS